MTPEQREANAQMDVAIARLARAYSSEESMQGVITDWIVVAAETEFDPNSPDDPSEDTTAYNVLMQGGGLAWHRANGLLLAGRESLSAGLRGRWSQ